MNIKNLKGTFCKSTKDVVDNFELINGLSISTVSALNHMYPHKEKERQLRVPLILPPHVTRRVLHQPNVHEVDCGFIKSTALSINYDPLRVLDLNAPQCR